MSPEVYLASADASVLTGRWCQNSIGSPPTDRNTEDAIREEFITRTPNLSDARPANKWDWYFLMQHYGSPTRLLDWSEGAMIGLYFAVRDWRNVFININKGIGPLIIELAT